MTATLFGLLDLDRPAVLHGRPLPLCREEDTEPRKYISSSSNGQQFGLYCNRMLRGDRYKYIWNLTDIDEFYDLETDPGEKVNLIAEEKYAATIAEMRKALHAELLAHGDPLVKMHWVDAQLLEGRQHLR